MKQELDIISEITKHILVKSIDACGSRVTCFPPVMDTDADYLVFIERGDQNIQKIFQYLISLGFNPELYGHYQDQFTGTFVSMRKEHINLIVSANADFVKRHHAATYICKTLNLLNKQNRKSVFQAVLYGEIK